MRREESVFEVAGNQPRSREVPLSRSWTNPVTWLILPYLPSRIFLDSNCSVSHCCDQAHRSLIGRTLRASREKNGMAQKLGWARTWHGRSYDLGRMTLSELWPAYATYPAIQIYAVSAIGAAGAAHPPTTRC